MTTFLDLPPDIIRSLPDLSMRDIISLCKSNRRYNQALCDNDSFWRSLARQRLTDSISVIDSKSIPELKKDLLAHERNTEKILYYAERGYEKPVARLIQKSNDDDIGKAFQEAAARGYLDVVRILFPVLGLESEYMTMEIAFAEAAKGGHIPIIDFLFPYVDEMKIDDAFFQAAGYGHLTLLKHLLPHTSELAKREAIRVAARNGWKDVVDFLLPYSDEKEYRNEGFSAAAHSGYLEIVEMMLPYITDQWEIGRAAINAYWEKHYEILRLLFPLSPENRQREIIKLAKRDGRMNELAGLV